MCSHGDQSRHRLGEFLRRGVLMSSGSFSRRIHIVVLQLQEKSFRTYRKGLASLSRWMRVKRRRWGKCNSIRFRNGNDRESKRTRHGRSAGGAHRTQAASLCMIKVIASSDPITSFGFSSP
jgi:hypothetical protein